LDVSEQPLFAGGDAAVRAGKERAYAFALFEADALPIFEVNGGDKLHDLS